MKALKRIVFGGRRGAVVIAAVTCTLLSPVYGQQFCGSHSNSVLCLLPSIVTPAYLKTYGLPFGTVGPTINTPTASSVFVTQLTSALPLPSPDAGVSFTFDPTLNSFVAVEDLGPAVSERADTIGRHRFALGFVFQRFSFNSVDGVDLHNIPILFPTPGPVVVKNIENNSISLDQSILTASFGLSSRVDISAGIPFNSVHFGNAFTGSIAASAIALPPGALNATATGSGTRNATGLGDVTLQVKGEVMKRERGGVAVGLAVRTPTGDQYNALGAGAVGVRPFVAASYGARWLAPHINLGYEWNGDSIVMGSVVTGTTRKIPNQVAYAVGFDSGINKRLTANFDIIGRQLIHADRIVPVTVDDVFGYEVGQGSVNMSTAALGFKYNPFRRLLVGGDVLFRINDGGFHYRVAPLLSVSYTL